ncbi:MAG TPA: gamma-glutamyltransferase [Longimicrobiaceae bacterium]|nr:gamma-glutamyltransferase [Longimicrobiaceae bacterium]
MPPRVTTALRSVLALALALALAPGAARAAPVGPAPRDSLPGAVRFPAGWALSPGDAPAVSARGGMVATTDPVASEVGAEMLRRGGNAVDAAIATQFALAVVNPEAGNIGGGGFMVVRMADGTTAALDFREEAPGGATRDMYLDARGKVTDRSLHGPLAVGVPGSVAGMWAAHERFGSLPWAELLQPAINLADGLVVHERLARSLSAYEARLRQYPATAAVFLPGGKAPRVGDRLVQSDLAATLRRIAQDGRDGFYGGKTAALVAAEMRRSGGLITEADLAAYRAVWRDPVVFTYRGHTVVSMPPPSSGGATMAELLNILEGYDLRSVGYLTPAYAHLFAEAAKRAYADRNTYLADPDVVPQPVARMTSKQYAARRRADIPPARATPSAAVAPGLGPAPAGGTHTTHFSVVDAKGDAVAVTTTLNSLYGNAMVVSGAGFLLNNEMDDFTAKPGVPNQFGLVQGEANAVAPGKRMLSAMSPTILLSPAGKVELVTGSPGGATIITTVAQMIIDVVDWGMDLRTATAAPRLHHQHLPDVLFYEHGGLPPETVAALRASGQAVEERDGYQGDVQSVAVLPDGTLLGVSDPRRGGYPAGVAEVLDVVQ